MTRPTESTRAVLLRSVAYGEADRIVTLLTDTHGKVSLIARSARASKKRFGGGALEAFGIIDAEIALGNAEIGRLAAARLTRGFPRLLGALDRMEHAGAGLEIVRELLPAREPDPRFVPTIERFFERLDDEHAAPEARLAFELRFLALVGLSPRLDGCGRCGRLAGDRAGLFDPAIGALVCRACGGGPIHLGAAARARMIASQAEAWADGEPWSERERAEATAAIDAFLRRQLGKKSGSSMTNPTDTKTDAFPTEMRAPRGARVLEIDWSDGATTRHEHVVLRGFCPCAHCQGHQGPIEWAGDASLEALEIASIEEVGNYAVRISWADGHSVGIYTWQHLRALGAVSDRPIEEVRRARFGR